MRISKEPETRKQEILETALKLFGEKGYEKTSIADIAKTMGVAQGLCYRYFPSKEALFDSAIEQYATLLTAPFLHVNLDAAVPLKQLIEEMPLVIEDHHSPYYAAFHGSENKKFHDQLSLKVCEKMVPIVETLLQNAQQQGDIHIADLHTAALFCVYGQLGILFEKDLPLEEKASRIRQFLIFALHL